MVKIPKDEVQIYDTSERRDYSADDLKDCTDYERPYLEAVASLPEHFRMSDTYERRMLEKARMVDMLKSSKLPYESLINIAAEYYARLLSYEAALNEAVSKFVGNKAVKPKFIRELFGVEKDLLYKGAKFAPKRREGALALATKYIHRLVEKNSSQSAKVLLAKADKRIIGKMTLGTFQNHVTNARRKYLKKK